MFRSLVTIIRELCLYLTKVVFMLKPSLKLHHYIYLMMWQHHSARHTTHIPLDDVLLHRPIYMTT